MQHPDPVIIDTLKHFEDLTDELEKARERAIQAVGSLTTTEEEMLTACVTYRKTLRATIEEGKEFCERVLSRPDVTIAQIAQVGLAYASLMEMERR